MRLCVLFHLSPSLLDCMRCDYLNTGSQCQVHGGNDRRLLRLTSNRTFHGKFTVHESVHICLYTRLAAIVSTRECDRIDHHVVTDRTCKILSRHLFLQCFWFLGFLCLVFLVRVDCRSLPFSPFLISAFRVPSRYLKRPQFGEANTIVPMPSPGAFFFVHDENLPFLLDHGRFEKVENGSLE